jgi:hypothetical protein
MLSNVRLLGDITFPELLFEGRLLAWWVILLGLAVELPFVRLLAGFDLKRCILADLAMNAASTLLGILLIPILGLGWEIGAYRLLGKGSFDLVHWAGTFLLAVTVNSAIELSVLRFDFKQKLGIRGFWWLCVANCLSVAPALWTLFYFPPQPYSPHP